jgi:outer membrane protein assembly factor BamD (BamD/ComL family)
MTTSATSRERADTGVPADPRTRPPLTKSAPAAVAEVAGDEAASDASTDAVAPGAATRVVTPQTAQRPVGAFDVWSRWGDLYRTRAVVLLVFNVAVFAGVTCFAYWLRSGTPFAPASRDYWGELARTLNFSGDGTISLSIWLLEPVSVLDVPMQIPVLGLLLATLISMPILVAQLYRFWAAVPFILMVAFFAVMPWLAATLTLSCAIASARPFRSTIRFMSALFALVPAVIYLYLGSSLSPDVVGTTMDPIDRMKFVAPWVMAIVASALAFAIVLTLARVVSYRPGVIAPLLGLMFAVPIGLFERYVGRDELRYRLVRDYDRYAFADRDTSLSLEEAIAQEHSQQPYPRRSWAQVRSQVEPIWRLDLVSDLHLREEALCARQNELVTRWDEFLHQFPTSPYALNALYFKALALDTCLDAHEFRRTGWVRSYRDRPSGESRRIWQALLANAPPAPIEAAVLLKLAELDSRDGLVERAIERLDRAIVLMEEPSVLPVPQRPVLARAEPITSLDIPLPRFRVRAHQLRDLLSRNADPRYGFDPLCGSPFEAPDRRIGLLLLNPLEESYPRRLETLRARYSVCVAADNIALAIALTEADPAWRAERLEQLIRRYPEGDAIEEAMYRLGLALHQSQRSERGDVVLTDLMRGYPRSIWARQAEIVTGQSRVALLSRSDPDRTQSEVGSAGRGNP